MMKSILCKIKRAVNSVTQSYNKIGGWRSIPSMVGLVALIGGIPVAFALGAEIGAIIVISVTTLALVSGFTHCLIGLVDNQRKKRYENTLNQYYSHLTQGTNNDTLAASMSADFSGETKISQHVPATRVNNMLTSPCLKQIQ